MTRSTILTSKKLSQPLPVTYLTDKVWDAQSPVYLLKSGAICVVQKGIQLVEERPLVTLTLTGSGWRQKFI